MLSPRHVELLKIFDNLPLHATVPLPVAAAYCGVSEKTIRRLYNLIRVSAKRQGVRKADLVEKAA